MEILDIFGHFYLNHLSPLWGYFSSDTVGLSSDTVDFLSDTS